MSYDLMVFDPKAPPDDRAGFLEWYDQQTQWKETHHYDNPNVSTPELQSWFMEMISQYPAMNGPYASNEVDNPKITDYSVGISVIYAAFAWSEAESAYETMFRLAKKHKVGFFNVSGNDIEVWGPDSTGGYSCIYGRDSTCSKRNRRWWEFWKLSLL